MAITRRNFIRISGMTIGGATFALSCKIQYPGYYFFTEEEARCIVAICEQIIPADKDPGATDAGVVYYIDKQLDGYFKSDQELYRKGISAIQFSCQTLHKCNFEELDATRQINFMKKMEKGALEEEVWKEFPSERFFRTLVDHTMQGFYGSPRHGGNKDYLSYTMMGLEYPLIIGQNRYKEQIIK